jgi:hypothetical protein
MFMVHLFFVLAMLFLSCLVEPAPEEQTDKRIWFDRPACLVLVSYSFCSPEKEANLFSLALFQWPSSMIVQAYKKTLTVDGSFICAAID